MNHQRAGDCGLFRQFGVTLYQAMPERIAT
jgi:hypothetical protein